MTRRLSYSVFQFYFPDLPSCLKSALTSQQNQHPTELFAHYQVTICNCAIERPLIFCHQITLLDNWTGLVVDGLSTVNHIQSYGWKNEPPQNGVLTVACTYKIYKNTTYILPLFSLFFMSVCTVAFSISICSSPLSTLSSSPWSSLFNTLSSVSSFNS